jgi:hypothetical protein
MLIPTHSILAEGKGENIVVERNLQDLHYGTWLLGVDSITLINTGPLDTAVRITSSLVHKSIGGFFGEADALETLTVLGVTTTGVKKTLKINNPGFEKLFAINNISHNIKFTLNSLTGETIPQETKVFIHFSLYKTK